MTSSGNISSINNQSASLIGLDDPLSYLSRDVAGYQVGLERQQNEHDYGNINDNSSSSSSPSATVLKQSYS